MPLPWKKEKPPKKKINLSLSRFINEIRASKRGESLVVETGFPTSVIDLIVKNRSRFITTKKHRLHHHSKNDVREPNTLHVAPFILNSINTLLSEAEANEELIREAGDNGNLSECDSVSVVNRLQVREFETQDRGDSEVEISVRRDRVFTIAVKLLVVLILAVSTKKFAISLTLSAFLLLFVEISFKSFVNQYKRLTVLLHFEKGERRLSLIDAEDDDVVTNFVDLQKEFQGMVQEKEATEIEVGEDVECVGGDEVIAKPRRKVSDKLRAKFKKLGGELRNRRSKKDKDCKLEQTNVESTMYVIEDAGDKEEKLGAANTKDDEETDVCYGIIEKPRRYWSWSTSILVVIVLAGLVGGRIMALVLSTLCLLLHRLVGQKSLST